MTRHVTELVTAYGRGVEVSAQVRQRKSRSNRAVLSGIVLMAAAMVLSGWGLAPLLATTLGAILGFSLLMYGVHVGWLVFYDRESDGPSS